jgi:phage tail sheath protein FI
MPAALTYPGVYIEEVPSGVHTITGVSTSVTAFVGYTARGAVNEPVHIFSFADFERAFGGLAIDSPLSYCVKQFFQNGGTETYVVRVAQGSVAATVTLRNAAGVNVLEVRAASAGTWGNNLRIDVDYDTTNPGSLFNLRVTELVLQNGRWVPGTTEVFRNLTMNSFDPAYAVSAINAGSELISVARPPALAYAGNGTSVSDVLTLADATPLPAGYRFSYALNGQGPFEATVATPTPPAGAALTDALNAIIADVVASINAAQTPGVTGAIAGGNRLQFTAVTDGTHPAERSSIRFLNASSNSVAARLKLGVVNGGTEVDAAATVRPAQNGTAGTATLPATAAGDLTFDIRSGASGAPITPVFTVPIWGAPTTMPAPTSLDELVSQINAALAATVAAQPFLAGATARRIGNSNVLRILPGATDANISFLMTGATATTLGLTAATARNVARYAPGTGVTALAQLAGVPGNNGTAPGPGDLTGSEAAKTGLYALENVDLFNILVMPDATIGAGLLNVVTEAIAYCERRRAFMIIDAPETVAGFAQAQMWMGGAAAPLRSRNAAIYFPRLREADPMMNNVVRSFAAAGAVAGLYARTDAERGVWKAPAGMSAVIIGATGLSYTLTDKENGALNPLGLNCLRTFPVAGTVSWGARTGRGADTLADEYKYVPVRRMALFLEESLYRGTQWVVFEPNDAPLWAQIRLNLGAFMQGLFRQGAFQGSTPRDAYFVKCDGETTTQADINLGVVNILVGFAPLKPAEFVVIKIQQIAGNIPT